MRHQRHKNRLGVTPAHRKLLLKNLSAELIDHGKITTTLARTKALRSYVEKLVTIAKEDTVANRRLVASRLGNKKAVQVLFKDVAPKFKDRKGGYTRTMRLADGRVGDNAKMGIITFVE